MAIALGVHAVAADNTGPATTTSGVATQATGSNFYIVVSYPNGDTISGGAPTDNKSNTYTLLSGMSFDDTSDGYLTKVFECKNGAGGSGHTATLTLDSTDRKCIYFVEVTGADTSSSIDQSSIARDASSPFDGTALTTTNANDLIFAFIRSSDIANSTITLNGSFTQVDINSTTTASILGSRTVSATGTYSPAATATGGTAAVVALWAVKQGGATSATATPGVGSVTLNGKNPITSAFQNVRIRQILVNEGGQAIANAANITLLVWYGGICHGAPDVSINGQTTDANGTTSWSIATGTLGFNDKIFYVAQDSASYSNYTCARLTPNYE